MRTLRDILNIIFVPSLIISVPYILICLPAIVGYVPFEVDFESMAPTYNQGELVYYSAAKKTDFNVGDLVLYDDFQIENARVFHRIVDIKADGFVTKADGNDLDDESLLLYEDVIGRISDIKIPSIGPYLRFANNNLVVIYASVGLWGVYGLLCLFICLSDYKKRIKMGRELRRERKKKLAEQKMQEQAKAAQAAQQAQQATQTQPVQPVQPAAPAQPVQPVQPAAPAQSVQPVQQAQPAAPVQPVQTAEPAQPAS